MTGLTANFDLGVNGQDVKSSDAGSLTTWDSVTGATGTMVYDNTHLATGSIEAAKCSTGFASWTAVYGSEPEHWERFYCYFTANPSAGPYTFGLWVIGGNSLRVRINTSGNIELTLAGTAQATSSSVIGLNQWIRIETHIIHNPAGIGTGVFECRYFSNQNATVPTEAFNANGSDTGNVPPSDFDVGNVTALGGNPSYWVDWIANSQTDWIGPAAAASLVVPGPGALMGRVGSR